MRPAPLLVASALCGAFAPGVARAAAPPPPPPPEAVIRAVYPKFDPKTGTTGERGEACGRKGRRTASLVVLRPWRGLGRDQWVALFGIWVREDRAPDDPPPEDPADDGWAQACGPRPAQVALLEAGPSGLRVIARSAPDLSADALDLAPYRLRPGETLVGTRGAWMNHGFGETTLTLLRVEGARLVTVAELAVDLTARNVECHGTVSMLPDRDRPAGLRVTWKVTELDDDANERSVGTEALTFRWTGEAYEAVPEEAARVRRCVRR